MENYAHVQKYLQHASSSPVSNKLNLDVLGNMLKKGEMIKPISSDLKKNKCSIINLENVKFIGFALDKVILVFSLICLFIF